MTKEWRLSLTLTLQEYSPYEFKVLAYVIK